MPGARNLGLENIRNWKLEGEQKKKQSLQICDLVTQKEVPKSLRKIKEMTMILLGEAANPAYIYNTPVSPTLKTELKLIHSMWKRNRKSCGCPGRQCLFKLRNTSLTKFVLLYPILEPWHKVQSSSQKEKDKCGYKNQSGRDLSKETAE